MSVERFFYSPLEVIKQKLEDRRKEESCFREEVDVDIKRQKKEAGGRRARAQLDSV